MVYSDKPTGQAGQMRIDFDGATVRFYVYGGYSTTNSGGLGWSGTVNGVGVGGTTPWPMGSKAAPGILFGAWTANYGQQTVSFTLNYTGTSGLGGPTTHTMVINRPYPTTVPGAPNTPNASDVTPTSMTLSWNIPGDGGLGIDQMLLRGSTDPNFGSYTDYPNAGNVTSRNVGGLTPGTNYFWRVYAHNGNGYSASSGIRQQATLPSVAPGMSVLPTLDGTKAVVTLTPPGGASGVTKYRVEYRPVGGATTAVESASSPINVVSLTPGGSYQWRASAFFGTYESPLTSWVTVVQPRPNTSPGNYFDGSTVAQPGSDVTYSWTGTAGSSTSRATGVSVDGWAVSNTETVLQRVTGGRSGQYTARMVVVLDCSGPVRIGMTTSDQTKKAAIEANATYVGSIYVRPSRSQRLRSEIVWYNAAGSEVTPRALSAAVVVSDTIGWTRLVATGVAPATATRASIRVYDDFGGAGHVAWKSGEWLDADDAMVSLSTLFDWFSGSTPDVIGFDYTWLGTPNASVSARLETPVEAVDLLADPDCPAPPAPPSLPTIAVDCIEEVGTWRRYTLTIPSSEVREWSSTLPTLVLTTAGQAERQVRIRYYPNPDGLPPEQVTQDGWDAELILTYIPPLTEITMDGVTETVTAAVAGNAPISANRLLYGTGGIPATWPELRCGIGYIVTLDVPLDAPAGNLSTRIIVTQRM